MSFKFLILAWTSTNQISIDGVHGIDVEFWQSVNSSFRVRYLSSYVSTIAFASDVYK